MDNQNQTSLPGFWGRCWGSKNDLKYSSEFQASQLQVKIENIYSFEISLKNMESSLKTGFAQISIAPQQIWVPQNLSASPARTPMVAEALVICL